MRVRPSRVRRLRTRKAIGNAALAGAVLAVGLLYVALEKNVTLVVNGEPQAVRTLSASVGELLDSSGIALRGKDVVVPPPATPLADGMTVVVDTLGVRAAVGGPADVGVWVMEGTVGPAAKLAILPTEDRFSMNQPVGTSRVVGVRVVVLGKDHDILTNASTVRELLSAMGIEPDGGDRVLPSPRTPLHPGMSVRYADIEFRTRELDVPIPFVTSTSYSDTLDPGEIRVTRRGEVGLAVETYRVRLVNGEVVGRVLLDRRVIREAIPAHRVVGHRESGSHGTQSGEAAWYDAPGTGYTAAHPSLPFGTVVTVTNVSSGESVKVVINDRGPFGGRIIDLSPEAFDAITGNLGQGICQVRLSW
jgi:uncharacterized protein YabE (DUF348 family)